MLNVPWPLGPSVVDRCIGGALAAGFALADEKCHDEADDGLPREVQQGGDEAEDRDDGDGYSDPTSHLAKSS